MTRLFQVLCGGLVYLLVAVSLQAQIIKGTFVGTVMDSSRAAIPGATITVRNLATNVVATTVTDSVGNFTLPFLDEGLYSVQVEHAGFKATEEASVKLDIAAKVRVDFTLEVGSASEVVTVSGATPLLQTDTSTVSMNLTGEKLDQLPLLGRNYQQLAQLAPTAVAPTVNDMAIYKSGTLTAGNYYQVGGARGSYISYTTDGVGNQDIWWQSEAVIPPLDSIQEFNVQISNVPAEYGFGVVQFTNTSRQGTNVFHGTAYEYLQNADLNANGYFPNLTHTPRTPFQENQFGAAVGGPIYRNKSFFFVGYEGHRHNQSAAAYANWPEKQWLQGDFSDLTAADGSPQLIYDPASTRSDGNGGYIRDPFPGNIIPSDRIDSVAQGLIQYIPSPNAPGVLPGENFKTILATVQDVNQGIARIDYNVSKNDKLYGHYLQSNEDDSHPSVSPLSGATTENRGVNVMLGETHTFSADLLNELRIGYNRAVYLPVQDGANGSTNYSSAIGLKNLTTNPDQFGLPSVSWGGYSAIGPPPSDPLGAVTNTFQLSDNLIRSFGTHSIKTGTDIRKTYYTQISSYGARGVFGFSNNFSSLPSNAANTGSPFADFLLGLSNTATGLLGDTEGRLHGIMYSGYVQDDWRITRSLTANIGIRYENYRPWAEEDGKISGWDPGMIPGSCFGYGCPAGVFLPTAPGKSWYSPHNNDWGPRVGFAYSPFDNNETVVRASYGLLYSPTDTNEYMNGILDPPNSISLALMPQNPYTDTTTTLLTGLFPGGVLPPRDQPLSTANWTLPAVSPYPYVSTNKDGEINQWQLGIQHSFRSNNVLEVGYIGSHAEHGQHRVDYNQSRLDLPGQLTTVASRAPYPSLGVFTSDVHDAVTIYNAGYVRAERRFSHGYSFVASYTFAKTMDNSGNADPPPQNTWNPKAEWGLSLFDTRHRFTLGYVWDLPLGRGQQFASNVNRLSDELISGWQVSGITTFQTGSPFNLFPCCIDYSNTGQYFFALRPNINGPVNYLNPRRPGNLFFDPSVFSVPELGTFGNAARGVTVGPGINNFDIALMKDFSIWENVKLQFRSDMSNAFNHAQFTSPFSEIGPGITQAGTVTSTTPPRRIQLALRVLF